MDTTPPQEQGIIQGFMVGGRALAVVVTASGVGYLAEFMSWTAVFWALAMQYTDTRIAASMYAILMAITNVGQGAGMAVSGLLSDQIGFRGTFGILAALNLVALPLLAPLFQVDPDHTRG